MYADCTFSSRLHAEGRLEEQLKRWVEFYWDSEEVTPNPLLYVFDTVDYRGVIRRGGGGSGDVEEGEDEQEQEEEDLMETLQPRHKRLWNFLSKLPAPGRWKMIVGFPLKKAFSLTVKFACVERLPDVGADAEEEDGEEDNNDDEEGKEEEDTGRQRFVVRWTQGKTLEIRTKEDVEIDTAGIMNLVGLENMWCEWEKRMCILMKLNKVEQGQKTTLGRGRDQDQQQKI